MSENDNREKPKKRILFLCVGNAVRSIIAEAYARKYLKEFEVESAGVRPLGTIPSEVIQILNEDGIDTSELHSKPLNTSKIPQYEYIVILARILFFAPPQVKVIYREFEDPGLSPEFLKRLKDEIKNFITELSTLVSDQNQPPSLPTKTQDNQSN